MRNRPNQNFTKLKLEKNYFTDTNEILDVIGSSAPFSDERCFTPIPYAQCSTATVKISIYLFHSRWWDPINYSNGSCTVVLICVCVCVCLSVYWSTHKWLVVWFHGENDVMFIFFFLFSFVNGKTNEYTENSNAIVYYVRFLKRNITHKTKKKRIKNENEKNRRTNKRTIDSPPTNIRRLTTTTNLVGKINDRCANTVEIVARIA